mmetsp:Transcript_41209/g.78712  ORF Transcript_41209/g.78712 Transcript_41209/m.78712 type:complete len:249 (+) Transcript_41209:491-1237(+)
MPMLFMDCSNWFTMARSASRSATSLPSSSCISASAAARCSSRARCACSSCSCAAFCCSSCCSRRLSASSASFCSRSLRACAALSSCMRSASCRRCCSRLKCWNSVSSTLPSPAPSAGGAASSALCDGVSSEAAAAARSAPASPCPSVPESACSCPHAPALVSVMSLRSDGFMKKAPPEVVPDTLVLRPAPPCTDPPAESTLSPSWSDEDDELDPLLELLASEPPSLVSLAAAPPLGSERLPAGAAAGG